MLVRFYTTVSGRNPVLEFIKKCSPRIQGDFADALTLLENGVMLSMPASRPLSTIFPGLYELRLKDRSGQLRIFYWIKKSEAIYFVHAIHKKTQALPRREIDLILRRIKEV